MGAAAFWSYNASVSPYDPDFVAGIWTINAQMAARNLSVCPTNCSCDQLSACGQPYLPPPPPLAGATLMAATCAVPVPPVQAWAVNATDGTLRPVADATLCVALPAGGGPGTYPLQLSACDAGPQLSWTRSAATGHFVTTASGVANTCIDMRESDGAVGLYACGSGDGLSQSNQAWAFDAYTGVIATMGGVGGTSGGKPGTAACVTAVNPAAALGRA